MASKDYKRLYDLINNRVVVPAFIDFSYMDSEFKHRDVCAVQKRGDFDIKCYVRGVEYFAIYSFIRADAEANEKTEYDLFVLECTRRNLEFYE